MTQLIQAVTRISRGFNVLAGAAVVAMMLLTCADVVLRLFRRPVPGTYEIVGFLGTVVIAFAMAYTSLEKGHIAVELLVERLPRRLQSGIEAAVSLIGTVLFGLLTWQSFIYAADLRHSGEVSVTLTMPIYPFIYGIAAGSGLLTLVLLVEALRTAARAVKP
ncbi:MAG: TRAP transporter small permease [Deltaproteobacteria bacterium]|nr:TRAP transporter small permease [Deltaproteobacteria bacterium]